MTKLRKNSSMPKTMEWTPEYIERFWNHESLIPENYFTFQFGHYMLRKFRPWLKVRKSILN